MCALLIVLPLYLYTIAVFITLKDFYRFEVDPEVLSRRLASKTTEKDILEYTKVRQRQWPCVVVTNSNWISGVSASED